MTNQDFNAIDSVDKQIIKLLMENAQMPYTEIAKKIFVSPGTVHVRMKKLIEIGLVKGAGLRVDYKKLGFGLTAFVGIYLEKNSFYDSVNAQIEAIPEVVFCHYITGNYSMFLKIICRDTEHLKLILHDNIQSIEGISRTESFISLSASIERDITNF